MPEIPYTTHYLIGALAFVFGIMGLFVVSLVVRYRNLNRDAQTIEQLSQDQ